jgi:hypothetical protein
LPLSMPVEMNGFTAWMTNGSQCERPAPLHGWSCRTN